MLVLKARVQSMDKDLEEMSASLGADGFTTFRRITLPAIAPAMVAGGFLSFMISFDNFAISYFLMPAGSIHTAYRDSDINKVRFYTGDKCSFNRNNWRITFMPCRCWLNYGFKP